MATKDSQQNSESKNSNSLIQQQKNSKSANRQVDKKEELEEAKSSLIRQYPSAFESNSSVNNILTNIALHNLGTDYYQNYCQNIEKVTIDEVMQVAKELLSIQSIIILIVGDKTIIENDNNKLDITFTDITEKYIQK